MERTNREYCEKPMNYQKFAHVYDQVMDQQLYDDWTYAVRSFSHSAIKTGS